MTIPWLRALRFHIWRSHPPNSRTPSFRVERPKSWSAKDWVSATLAGIRAIAGPEGYALTLGIDGTNLRAALKTIDVSGGAGFGRVLK